MNQILSIEAAQKTKKRKKGNNSGPMPIKSVLKIFSITLIIFGIFMVGSGSNSMYKNSQIGIATKPTISVTTLSEGEIILKIEHNQALAKLTYNWNEEEEIELNENGKRNVEQSIEIPKGTNVLNVYVEDINGQVSTYQRTYTIEGDITIDITAEGNNIKISTEAKNGIAYLTYRWDNEEEEKVEVQDYTNETSVEIPKGEHTLTVIAVDYNNQTQTETQKVKGVTKPTLEIKPEGASNFVIKASDEEGLKKLEITRNGENTQTLDINGDKEFEYKVPIEEGENRLEVTVYNESDLTETVKVKANKAKK